MRKKSSWAEMMTYLKFLQKPTLLNLSKTCG